MRRLLIGTAIGLAAALVATLLGLLPFVRTIEMKSYDWRIRQTADPASARRDIVMVAIDESSIRKLDPLVGRWPWPRMVHSVLLDFLSRAPAKAIIYDVIFSEKDLHSYSIAGQPWTGAESDAALVEATRKAGNVVHVADVVADATEGDQATGGAAFATPYRLTGPIERRTTLVPPFPELAAASRALGHNLVILDPDGPVRRLPPFVNARDQFVPSLATAAAMLVDGLSPSDVRLDAGQLALGGRRVPLVAQELPDFYGVKQKGSRMLVRFPGGVLNDGKPTYAEYSFYDLFYSEQQLQEGQKPLVDPLRFKDAIVLVGTTAPGLSDLFTVPFQEGKMPGMQVHASALDNILNAAHVAPSSRWLDVLLLLGGSMAAGMALSRLGVWPGLAVSSGLLLGLLAGSVALFSAGTWIPLVVPSAGLVVAAFGGVGYQYLVEGREKRKVKGLFARYVPKDVCDQLMANPALARLGGQRREMTVLFSDIRGFTTFSEQGTPEQIVAQLNEYFERMVQVLFEHHGTLDKFVGDAVMALFGAPLEDPIHADNAVCAARAMIRELDDLNKGWARAGRPTLDIGIGVNTGDMVAGNIGASTIMSYTVIGDAVNLGARLESLNKEYGTHIIISEATRTRLKGRYDIRGLGDVVVKGKTRSVAIYEVVP